MPALFSIDALNHFPDEFRGRLLRPQDAAYANARLIFNMRYSEAKPALIAQPVDQTDIRTALRHASAHALPVAIRSGGHGIDGTAMPDGALVLDMTGFRSIEVDADKRTVRAGAGVLLGEIDAAAQRHGLVVPSGTVSSTGIAGLTLGGGVGTLMRRFGATVDNLIGCTMVALNGDVVTASATENAELFWALCGGGGNFGVVTTFEYRAQLLDHDVTAGMILFPFEEAPDILAELAGWMPTAPRELAAIAALLRCPPLPAVPPDVVGKPVMVLVVVHCGRPETASGVLDRLIGLGTPIVSLVRPAPWVTANSMLDAIAPYGRRSYARGGYLSELSMGSIAVLRDSIAAAPPPRSPGPNANHNIWFMGGAISEDYLEDSVAFSREGAAVFWECATQWDRPDQDDAFVAWADAAAAALPLRANGYSNLSNDQGEAWRRGLWGSLKKFDRLRLTKAKWDPTNLFRFNKNIPLG